MFVVTFNGIYIGLYFFIEDVFYAGASVGPSVGTDMNTYAGVIVSISVMKPLQYDGGYGSEEMGFSISIPNSYSFSSEQR